MIGVNAGSKPRSSGLQSAHVAVTAFGVKETLPARTMRRDNQLVYLDQKKVLRPTEWRGTRPTVRLAGI